MIWQAGLLVILIIAAVTRLWRIDSWSYVLFDEADYATAAAQYVSGQAFVMNHPPLVPMQYAALAWLGGASAEQRFPQSLLPYGDFPFVLLRSATAVSGTLLVLFVALLARAITGSPLAGLLTGFFAAVDNALVLYARLILADTWLLLYGAAGLWCFLKKDDASDRRAWSAWLSCAGLLFGLAISVKGTGLFFPAVAFLHAAWRARVRGSQDLSFIARRVLLMPLLVVLTVTLVHWLLIDATGPVMIASSETPDNNFMTIRDRNPLLPNHPVLARITQRLAETALGYLYTIGGHFTVPQHAAASPWWQWPVMQKPMTLLAYRPTDHAERTLVVIGNPVVWLGGLMALIYTLWQRLRRRQASGADLLLLSYGFYLAVMALLPPPMFLYHYFPALIFMIILMASVLAQQTRFTPLRRTAVIALVIAGFLYLAPYTYGLSLKTFWIPRLPYIYTPAAL